MEEFYAARYNNDRTYIYMQFVFNAFSTFFSGRSPPCALPFLTFCRAFVSVANLNLTPTNPNPNLIRRPSQAHPNARANVPRPAFLGQKTHRNARLLAAPKQMRHPHPEDVPGLPRQTQGPRVVHGDPPQAAADLQRGDENHQHVPVLRGADEIAPHEGGGASFGLPGNASCGWRAPHIQAPQPSIVSHQVRPLARLEMPPKGASSTHIQAHQHPSPWLLPLCSACKSSSTR